MSSQSDNTTHTTQSLLHSALSCTCPQCGQGPLYKQGLFNLVLNDKCNICGLDLAKNDSADGPAVFLIFLLGAMLVPLALIVDAAFSPPLWVHAVLWGAVALSITIGLLKPLKSFVIALQFHHRPTDWESHRE